MLSPEARRIKVDGVKARIAQAREAYGREAAKCAELLLLLQADCPHCVNAEVPTAKGHTVRCMACDFAMEDEHRN